MTQYTSLPMDDSNLTVTLSESNDIVKLDIKPASFTSVSAGRVSSVNELTGDVVLTTDEIAEATNLYYTDGRVQAVIDTNTAGFATAQLVSDSATTTLTTANTYTDTQIATSISAIDIPSSTDEIAEATNLYYTDARVQSVIDTNTAGFDTVGSVDSKVLTAITGSMEYTDLQVAGLADASYVDTQDSQTLASAQDYTDTQLTGYVSTESDPVFTSSPAGTITNTNIANWNTSYTWGDHSTQGYLTDYTVTQSDVTQHQSALAIDASQVANIPAGYSDAQVDTHLNTSTATNLQVLSWTGSDYAWVDQSSGGGGNGGGGASALADLTDVAINTGLLGDGDILRYNGTASEWQNTNLGLTVSPTISTNAVGYMEQLATVTITNWGDYDDPNAWAQVKDSSGTVVIDNTAITDTGDGTLSWTWPATADDYTVEVRVQDFGDLASETISSDPVSVTQLFGWTSRYIRLTNFVTDDPNDMIITELKFYTGAGQTGTALPGDMTSATTPAPFSVTSNEPGFSGYEPWKVSDGNIFNNFWTLSTSGPAFDTVIDFDLGAAYTINSMFLRNGTFTGDHIKQFTIYTSDTGAFAGEEVERETLGVGGVSSYNYYN